LITVGWLSSIINALRTRHRNSQDLDMWGTNLVVSAHVVIREGCPIAMTVDNTDQARIICGDDPSEAFEFILHREAVRAFAELCNDALEQMDRLSNADDPTEHGFASRNHDG
jgi:hypothetical protein